MSLNCSLGEGRQASLHLSRNLDPVILLIDVTANKCGEAAESRVEAGSQTNESITWKKKQAVCSRALPRVPLSKPAAVLLSASEDGWQAQSTYAFQSPWTVIHYRHLGICNLKATTYTVEEDVNVLVLFIYFYCLVVPPQTATS